MIRPWGNKRGEDPEWVARRAQYKKQVGALRLFLLLECAPLVIDPLEIADEAFKRAFTQPGRHFSYCDIRKIAEAIVRERREEGAIGEYADYSLEKIFDPYLTEDLTSVRVALRAVDALSLGERRAVEANFLHLLTNDGLTDAVGGSESTRRGQKRNGLAKLAQANVNLSSLKPFFDDMKGLSSDHQDG